jgi:hypothetical protein
MKSEEKTPESEEQNITNNLIIEKDKKTYKLVVSKNWKRNYYQM